VNQLACGPVQVLAELSLQVRSLRQQASAEDGSVAASAAVAVEPEPEPEYIVARYDVRLQDCELQMVVSEAFDVPPSAPSLTAEGDRRRGGGGGGGEEDEEACEAVAAAAARTAQQHRAAAHQAAAQCSRRHCAVCAHGRMRRRAQRLVGLYRGWLDGVSATRSGLLDDAAAAFRRAAQLASAVGEVEASAALWSNSAECVLRCSPRREHGGEGASSVEVARHAVDQALSLSPGHDDSLARRRFLDTESEATSAWGARYQGGCCAIDTKYLGAQRTGGGALAQLAGEVHGAATELEAAASLGAEVSAQLWRHVRALTPRELSSGAVGVPAMNSHVQYSPDAATAAHEEAAPRYVNGFLVRPPTHLQEVDVMCGTPCGQRLLWCEVKAYTSVDVPDDTLPGVEGQEPPPPPPPPHELQQESLAASSSQDHTPPHINKPQAWRHSERSLGELSRWEALLDQLHRIREAARSMQHEHFLLRPPVVAVVLGRVDGAGGGAVEGGASASARKALAAQEFGCLNLPLADGGLSSVWRELGKQGVLPCPPPEDRGCEAAEGDEVHDAVLNLDQGMLALLVANIWDMTKDDMVAAGTRSLRLFSGEFVFSEPEGLLAVLAPLHRYLTSPNLRLVTCYSSAANFGE
jgi:hypothetical protein